MNKYNIPIGWLSQEKLVEMVEELRIEQDLLKHDYDELLSDHKHIVKVSYKTMEQFRNLFSKTSNGSLFDEVFRSIFRTAWNELNWEAWNENLGEWYRE